MYLCNYTISSWEDGIPDNFIYQGLLGVKWVGWGYHGCVDCWKTSDPKLTTQHLLDQGAKFKPLKESRRNTSNKNSVKI